MSQEEISQSSAGEGEESEEANEYVKDDFIDDNSYSDYDESKPKSKKKRKGKKRKHREVEDDQVDEDDLDLINENKKSSNRRKRIKKNREKLKEDQEEAQPQYDDEVSDGGIPPDQSEEQLRKKQQISVFKNIFDSSDDEEEKEQAKQEDKELVIRDSSAMGKFRDLEWRKKVMEINIPERIYIRLKDRLNPTEAELEAEAKWIYKYKKYWKGGNVGEERMVKSILNVLTHFRKNHFDIPFIATYRYYLFQHELQRSDFYDIYELDLEWDNFIKTKQSLEKKVKEVVEFIPGSTEIQQAVDNAMTTNDLHDVNLYITFCKNFIPQFQKELLKMRDAKKKSYLWMAQNNLDKFSREVSMPPHEFAQNLKLQNCVNKVPRRSEKPSELAKKYICQRYPNVLEILVLACTHIGDEMAAHPDIRKFVRERYMQGLRISTNPTEKGESELDCFHPDYKIKRLSIIPIEKFKDDTWLRIQRAKDRGLIEVVYDHDRVVMDTIDFMKNYYLESDPTDRHEKEWRTFYNEIIERVVCKLLLPDLEKRADQELRESAIEYVISKIKENFMKNYLMIPPYLFQKKACSMVSIIIQNHGKPILTAVHVNDYGDYSNHHAFNYLMMPYAEKNMPENYDADVKKLKEFIWDSKAGLIIIPAIGPEARNLKKLIKERIIEDPDTLSKMGHEPWMTFGTMEIPTMSTNNLEYDSDLKSFPLEVKQGVSLARFKQSPLNETLRLWSEAEGENMQILNLSYHEFQDSITKSRLIDVLRNTAVLCVNNIGVDLYHTVMNNNLQF